MKIDRARFLVLTGAISGAIAAAAAVQACTTATTTTPDAGSQGDSGQTGDGTTTEGGGGGDSGSDGGTDGPSTCDDTVGSRGACKDYADGGTGPDSGDAGNGCLDSFVCDGILGALKAKIAEKSIACIVTGPACESATNDPIADCISTALAGACTDDTGKAACDQIATACGDAGTDAGLGAADCLKLTRGMTSAGRTQFVSCMTESACFVTDPKDCLRFQ
jgi:hypothetical protein